MRYQTKLIKKWKRRVQSHENSLSNDIELPFFSFSLALPRHQAVGAALFVRGRALFWLRLRGQRVARYRGFQVDIGKSRGYSMYISIYYLYVYIYLYQNIYIQELHIYICTYIYNILSISMIFNCPSMIYIYIFRISIGEILSQASKDHDRLRGLHRCAVRRDVRPDHHGLSRCNGNEAKTTGGKGKRSGKSMEI